MKIILIHNKYQQAGGEDLVFQSEGELLKAHGHDVEFLVYDNKEIKTKTDKLLSGLKVIYNAGSSRQLQQKIKHFKPDIIHVHNFVPLASPSIFFTAKKYHVPVVVTLHNFRLICPSATLFYDNKIYEKSIHSQFPLDAIIKGIYRNSVLQTLALVLSTRIHNWIGTWDTKVTKWIALTEFAKNKFTNSVLKASEKSFIVKPNFVVDPGEVKTKREDFFLFVGRLTEEKGIETLLQSASIYEYKLVIIGDGPMRNKVELVAKTNPNVTYLGFQSRVLIIENLRKCKALLFPSTWYEGFPMTILEAFSTGTPVIASRLGSMEEVVKDNLNGLHFDPGNAKDLADKIRLLHTSEETAALLSQSARRTYLDYYTPEKNYQYLIDIYEQIKSKIQN